MFAAGDSRSPLAALGAALRASRFALQICRTRLFYVRGFESRRGHRERVTTCYVEGLEVNFGGERGIRTLEGLLALTPLAGVRLRPLGHLSGAIKPVKAGPLSVVSYHVSGMRGVELDAGRLRRPGRILAATLKVKG